MRKGSIKNYKSLIDKIVELDNQIISIYEQVQELDKQNFICNMSDYITLDVFCRKEIHITHDIDKLAKDVNQEVLKSPTEYFFVYNEIKFFQTKSSYEADLFRRAK